MRYLRLLRLRHYIKNLLIYAALVCSGSFFHKRGFLSATIGFIVFCMISSTIYIVNDIRDVEKDRKHPTKRKRPIASGEISIPCAWGIAGVMLVLSFGLGLIFLETETIIYPLTYLILNIGYSFGLKDKPIVDIAILSSGFVLRTLYGGAITGVPISDWLFLTVLALSLYFALGKRRNEMRISHFDDTRTVLKAYTWDFLDKSMYMCLGLGSTFYALWSMDAETTARYHNRYMVYTVPIVLLITLKYSMVIEGKSDGDPVEVLLQDKGLLVLCAIYIAIMFMILYL